MKLVYTATNREVKIGDIVTTFQGQNVQITGMEKPRHAGSTGRVYVKGLDGSWQCEYYPSVVDAEWIDREDRQ